MTFKKIIAAAIVVATCTTTNVIAKDAGICAQFPTSFIFEDGMGSEPEPAQDNQFDLSPTAEAAEHDILLLTEEEQAAVMQAQQCELKVLAAIEAEIADPAAINAAIVSIMAEAEE